MRLKPIKTLALVVSSALISPLAAWAVPLTEPAGSYADFAINGTTSEERPELGGLIVEDSVSDFTLSGPGNELSGTIQSRVVRSDVDDTLNFSWRITSVENNGGITAFRVGGFEGFALDADWRIDGLGDSAPDTARYFGSDEGAVNFLFDDPVSPGEESYFFFLETEATAYNRSGEFDLVCGESCVSEVYTTFAPVPVPAAAWLFGSALLGLVGIKRR